MSCNRYPLLSAVTSPEALKELDLIQLDQLAAEIRQRIIAVLSKTGGHLASNLGTVELTIALHTVFNSPQDKFIWDVSHQTYTHKILTGRNNQLETIRQFKGLCGFSNPEESPHDHFYCGHAGTALSLALGVAKNRDLTKRDEYVIPIIGDATLTCGMALEALNNISRDLKRFIIILNDNEMSISKNVGAITRILSRMLSNPTTTRIYQEIDTLVSKVPGFGSLLSQKGHKITESLKNLFSPAAFFEQFGLSYIGPINGHSSKALIDALEGVKNSSWPVILHVLTEKGHGLEQAQNNPITWHGAKPFCMTTYKFHTASSQKPTFPKIFGKQLLKMVERDPSIVVVTPAMSCGSSLDPIMEAFPDRCIDVGIAESHAVTYSGGIAYGGKMKIFTSIYSSFFQRAFDNLFHDVCLQRVPVVFAVDRAGIAGGDGHTHNGIYDIAFLNAMPNMVIAQPRDGKLLLRLMESAHKWGQPVAIRYPNLSTDLYEEEEVLPIEIGKGEIVVQGSEIAIVALGHMVETAQQVAAKLSTRGLTPTIVDPIFVKPLDSELFYDICSRHSFLVTIEDHSVKSGLGSILNHFLMSEGLGELQVANFGVPETFVAQGKQSELYEEIGLSADAIIQTLERKFSLPQLQGSAANGIPL